MQDISNKQELVIRNKSFVEIDGVNNIRSFDEESVLLESSAGKIAVEGEDLRIESLEKLTGRILICGRIRGVFYPDFKESKKMKGFFK